MARHCIRGIVAAFFLLVQTTLYGYTVNQVGFEFRPNGRYRVYLYYTVPALKEFREAYVEFTNRRKAEAYYFDMVKGADFYLPDPEKREFINQPLNPVPW